MDEKREVEMRRIANLLANDNDVQLVGVDSDSFTVAYILKSGEVFDFTIGNIEPNEGE